MASRLTLLTTVLAVTTALLATACGPGGPSHESLRAGRSVYADNCSACHGDRGQGGVGPALSAVREVWPSCSDHMEWIRLGSDRWQAERGPTYGALDSRIGNVMPGYDGRLTADEIAAVAAFERVEYGDGDAVAELTDCGLPPG